MSRMNLTINTSARTNLSNMSKTELKTLEDRMDGDDTLSKEELLEIAKQLLEHDKNTHDNHNLTQMVYLLKNHTPKLRHVQSVLLDYVTRAMEGKVGGKRKTRKSRKTKKAKVMRSRKH